MRALRGAPVGLAGGLALAYLLVDPPSLDLPAQLFRADLFRADPFGMWNNFWYGGHPTPGYSLLFPALAAPAGPQLPAAVAVVGTAALARPLLAPLTDGSELRTTVAALLAAAGLVTELLCGRLAFAVGLLPAAAAVLALVRGWTAASAACGVLAALCSPVAAVFAALAGVAGAAVDPARRRAGAGLVVACALPVAGLAAIFGEGGREPFSFGDLWPQLSAAVGLAVLVPRGRHPALRAGLVLYAAGLLAAFAVPSPLGANAARLTPILAAPLVAAVPRSRTAGAALLAAALVLAWQPPVRDLRAAWGDPSTAVAYWRPLVDRLAAEERHAGPFRVEVPFTRLHWEADRVAAAIPLARGWERQLDTDENGLFYDGRLTAARYRRWLDSLAVRYVALADAAPDFSSVAETALVRRGLPYLRRVAVLGHVTLYAVRRPTPLATGAAGAVALTADGVTLRVRRPGRAVLHVRPSRFWTVVRGRGCVAAEGGALALTLPRSGEVELAARFSLARIAGPTTACG